MKKIAAPICVLLLPLLGSVAQAASFDCAKAASKVEKQICETPGLSRLDDELTTVFAGAVALADDKQRLMHEQRRWLLGRNGKCESRSGPNLLAEEGCIARSYEERIKQLIAERKQLDGYTLVMSKDEGLCSHMLRLFTNDLREHDRGTTDHDEFKAVPWKGTRISFDDHGATRYWIVDGALLDFDNDGKLDYIVRSQGMLSSMPADSISVFPADVAARANELTSQEFYGAKNRIAIAGTFYPLNGRSDHTGEPLWRLSPLIYDGVSYVFMQTFYEPAGFKGSPTSDFMVIGKYGGGRFVDRDMSGQMEDICYFKRFGEYR
jgi:uncharacterized protein